MRKKNTPNKEEDHFKGELDRQKKKEVRNSIARILNDNNPELDSTVRVLITPKTLLPYLKGESEVYDYLRPSDMNMNKSSFMKNMGNYI